jgi:hypothetical protein
VPAAAVIPAPIAYIKVVAVKKLVVGFLVGAACPALCGVEHKRCIRPSLWRAFLAFSCRTRDPHRLL